MTFRRRLSMFVLLAAFPLHAAWSAEGSKEKSSEKPTDIEKGAPQSKDRPRTQAPDGTDNSGHAAKPAQPRDGLESPKPSGTAETPAPAKGKVDNDKNTVSEPLQGDVRADHVLILREDETLIRKRIDSLAGAISRSKRPAVDNSSASHALRQPSIDGTKNAVGVGIPAGSAASQHNQLRPAIKPVTPSPLISRQKELGRGPAIVSGVVPHTQATINGTQVRRKYR